jgi:hypothetical protein
MTVAGMGRLVGRRSDDARPNYDLIPLGFPLPMVSGGRLTVRVAGTLHSLGPSEAAVWLAVRREPRAAAVGSVVGNGEASAAAVDRLVGAGVLARFPVTEAELDGFVRERRAVAQGGVARTDRPGLSSWGRVLVPAGEGAVGGAGSAAAKAGGLAYLVWALADGRASILGLAQSAAKRVDEPLREVLGAFLLALGDMLRAGCVVVE